jgi:hypothetical protein
MAQVFISYSRKDKEFVRKLGDALAAQKREAWVDWKDIPLTAEWQQEIFTNIEVAENFIFVISPESAASANCKREIDHALANNKRMVPIFYRPVPDEAIPEALGKFQRIDFGDSDDFDAKFTALITAVDLLLPFGRASGQFDPLLSQWVLVQIAPFDGEFEGELHHVPDGANHFGGKPFGVLRRAP